MFVSFVLCIFFIKRQGATGAYTTCQNPTHTGFQVRRASLVGKARSWGRLSCSLPPNRQNSECLPHVLNQLPLFGQLRQNPLGQHRGRFLDRCFTRDVLRQVDGQSGLAIDGNDLVGFAVDGL